MITKLEIEGDDLGEVARAREIFFALVKTGGMTGVKGGQTIIHFDAEGTFQGVELNYWPYRRRKGGLT